MEEIGESLETAALKMNQIAYEGLRYLEVDMDRLCEDHPDIDR